MQVRSREDLKPGERAVVLGISDSGSSKLTKIVAGGPSSGEARAEARRKAKANSASGSHAGSDEENERSVDISGAGNGAAIAGVRAATASDAFDRLRSQFERRRIEQHDELTRAMYAVDINLFMEDVQPGANSAAPEFQLRGALPPTVGFRGAVDIPVAAAIGHTERLAARELIARHKEEDQEKVSQAAQAVRADVSKAHEAVRAARRRHEAPSDLPLGLRPGIAFIEESSVGDDSPRHVHDDDDRPTSACSRNSRTRTGDYPPSMVGSPVAKGHIRDLERDIEDYYGKLEADEDRTHIVSEVERQSKSRSKQYDAVRKCHFERRHRKREAAITMECNRRRSQEAFYDYRATVELQLFEKNEDKLEKKEQVARDIQERRARTAARKSAAASMKDFSMRHGALDKTCRQYDVRKIKHQDKLRTCERADAHREVWDARAQQIASRRTLCQAQRKLKDQEDQDRIRFLIRRQKGCEEQQVEERRERIRAQHAFDDYLRSAQKELTAREEEAAASGDVETYEKTLAALRDLAEGVRKQGMNMRAAIEGDLTSADGNLESPAVAEGQQDALQPVEPRVRSALAAAGIEEEIYLEQPMFSDENPRWDITSREAFTADSVENPVPRLFPQFSALPPVSAAVLPLAPGGTSAFEATLTSKEAALPSVRTASRQGEPLPLSARPCLALNQQVDPLSDTGRVARRQAQSLAALRRVRRTGPFSARGHV